MPSKIEKSHTHHGTAEFLTRNAVDALPEGGLQKQLAESAQGTGGLRVKLGIDPTAPDIHLGHVVVLQKLREFQEAGHTVVLIIGDFTARVGDPSGQSKTRPMLDPPEIARNADTFQDQAFGVLDRARTEVRFNGEWLDMAMADLFKLARTTTVARLLERDDFLKRYEGGQPISIIELLYPLLQGYDSVAVNADVEIGGTDQKFNLLLARAIQQAYGQLPQSIITMPILPGTDGAQRMSKSIGNYVGVTEPSEEQFGKIMSIPDEAMPLYYEMLTEIELDPGRHPAESKRALARAIVARFHSDEAAAAAEAHFDRVHKERRAPAGIEEAEIGRGEVSDGTVHLPALIATHFGGSRSDARRKLDQGGVKLNGVPVSASNYDLEAARLDGAILQVGKRHFRRLRLAR